MLISSLPKPIRKLAEKRYIDYATQHKHYAIDTNYAHISSFSWYNTHIYGEGISFWDSIDKGNFTPYYAMYGLPEKWAIKCLQEWLKIGDKVINKDWGRCVKSLNENNSGLCFDNYYHNDVGGSVSHLIPGYTEITLSDWIAANPANPENREETEELINGNNIPIQEEDIPNKESSKRPVLIENINSTNSRLKRIEAELPLLSLRIFEHERCLDSISNNLDTLINKLSKEDATKTKKQTESEDIKDGPLIKVLYCDNISKNMFAETDRVGFNQLFTGQVKSIIHTSRTVYLCDKITIYETDNNGERTGSVMTVFVKSIISPPHFVSYPFVRYSFK